MKNQMIAGSLSTARALCVTIVTIVTVMAGSFFAAPAHADYQAYTGARFDFASANNAVSAKGGVVWYRGARTLRPDVFRGQFVGNSYVVLRQSGCAYSQISWTSLTGQASWPPAGSAGSTTDGWYRQCGSRGAAIRLDGQSYASTRLFRVCMSIGYSSSPRTPRSYQSTWCDYN